MSRFAGIDVGAQKGFHICVVDGRSVLAGPKRLSTCAEVAEWLEPFSVATIAIDSPRSTASPGQTRRYSEAQFSEAKICGIRWTPEKAMLEGNSYYEWIVNGLHLYDVLEDLSADLVEVFPTASWTRWVGPRGLKTRAQWTRQGLGQLEIGGLPDRRFNQDDRDAIAAALTAQQFSEGGCDLFGEIAVPIR